MSGLWTLEDLPWDRFDPARVDPDILQVVKAAGPKPQGRLAKWAAWAAYRILRARSHRPAAATA